MELLIDVFGYLSVILAGIEVTAQSLLVGGVVFLLLVAKPLAEQLGENGGKIVERSRWMIFWSACALAVVVLAKLAIEVAILTDTTGISLLESLGAQSALANLTMVVLAVTVIQRLIGPRFSAVQLGVAAALILAVATLTAHASARLDGRTTLAVATGLHQAGAAAWIGGIPYFIMALALLKDGLSWRMVGKRFSQISMASVGLIFLSGALMAFFYIGSIEAVYGTAYGVMVATKAIMFGALLLFGYANYRTVERLKAEPGISIMRMRRFAEVEIGVGITVFFAAASLSSVPPAIDLPNDRVTLTEMADRLLPNAWPRLESPAHDTLALPALQAQLDQEAARANQSQTPQAFVPGAGIVPPRNAADVAWSEYNHHWSGIIVTAIALLALLERTGRARWARNWPLLFLVLGFFLFIRSDPETWPLGEIGFFESFRDPEVVQHRIFLVAILAFALFEWGVRTGRITDRRAAYVFPLVTAFGGLMLLTHSHAVSNVKEQLLIEITHIPLALAGITGGWARWLELRLDLKPGNLPSLIWPICFLICGIILLVYREA